MKAIKEISVMEDRINLPRVIVGQMSEFSLQTNLRSSQLISKAKMSNDAMVTACLYGVHCLEPRKSSEIVQMNLRYYIEPEQKHDRSLL